MTDTKLIEAVALALFANDGKWENTYFYHAPMHIQRLFRSDAQAAIASVIAHATSENVRRSIEHVMPEPYSKHYADKAMEIFTAALSGGG